MAKLLPEAMRVAIVTNMPAPYRVPAWNIVLRGLGAHFKVFFCARMEPNRNWDIPDMDFDHTYLAENYTKNSGGAYVHNNRDVWKQLKAFRPDVVITGGFNPTMLYSFLYCKLHRRKHIPMSDAWEKSERHLSKAHKILRKIVYRLSHAFISCSHKGKLYYQQYGIPEEKIFISHYTISHERFANSNAFDDRHWDLMFSGQFIERKNPGFFIEIAKQLNKRFPGLKVLLIGDGPLKEPMLATLDNAGIDYTYPGHVRQEDLPHYYSRSKIFLFPTAYDAWGVVAHEALASGTPTIITPDAGCSDELVLHGETGYVLPLDADQWATHCARLLQTPEQWRALSQRAREISARFSHQRAATALIDACAYAWQPKIQGPK